MKIASAFLLVISVSFLWAADFWLQKDYTTWTRKECETLLTKSPWVFTNSLFQAESFAPLEAGGRTSADRTVTFRFRLLSAKPVRMAFGRLELLENPNDNSLAERIARMVAAPADQPNHILVQIDFSVKPPSDPDLRNIHSFLLRANLSDFRDTVLASSDKVTVPIIEYRAPNAERTNAIFVFPRVDEKGVAYFKGDEKWLSIRTEIMNYRLYARNQVNKMKFHGEFEF